MSRVPPDRRATQPLPRAELAPVSTPDLDKKTRPTLTRCPLCVGQGMVAPEIAATFECLCEEAKEQT